MTLFRGYADDLPLMEWLQKIIWPAEQRLEREDVYWGTRLACLEMARGGTIRFWDTPMEARRDRSGGEGRGPARGRRCAADRRQGPGKAPKLLAKAPRARRDRGGGRGCVRAWRRTRSTPSPSRRCAGTEISEERDVPIEIHLSETEQEVLDCVAETGLRPAHYLDRTGMLGPRTLLAHCVWLDQSEIELIVERGATMVTNPVANQKLAVGGVFPYAAARAAGARSAWERTVPAPTTPSTCSTT